MDNKKNKTDFIDIKGLISTYIKKWYWFAISIIICGIGAYVYVKTHPRQSQVRSSILVTQDAGTSSIMSGLGGLLGADPYVQDEIFVITSHSVLKDVVKKLGLNKTHTLKTGFLTKKFNYPVWPVDVYFAPEMADTLSTSLDFEIEVLKGATKANITVKDDHDKIASLDAAQLPAAVNTVYGTFIVNTTDTLVDPDGFTTWVSVSGYDGAAESLSENLMAEIASKKSNVIELSINNTNSVYGIDVLNSIMATYNELGIEERNQRATKTAEFIQERLELISRDLNDAESQIENYKEGKNLIDIQTEARLNTQLKTNYENQIVELQTKKEILQMTLKFLSNDENKYDLMPVSSFDSETSLNAIDTYNELVLKRMELMAGAKPNNRQIKDFEKQIDAMRANILSAIQQLIKSTDVAISDAQAQANLAMSKLGNIPTQEREFINLKRQQEVKQQLYLFLLQRSEETAMLIANAIPKGQIIDQAYVMRDPVGTSKTTALFVAVLLGLFIPMIIIYTLGLLRSKMSGIADIEKYTGLPVLGEMCLDKSGEHIIVNETAVSPAAELLRMIRTNLQFVLANKEDKAVMVTSSTSGEGKSFIATNLAASLALLGKKTILIGMDIRKPQLANYLGVSPTPGLTQFLADSSMQLSQVVRSYDDVQDLDIIVAGPIPPNPGELMTSRRVQEMMEQLRQHYDYIIIDTAPVGMVSDAFNLTKYVDATIYVVYDHKTRLQDLRFLNNIVDEGKLKRVNVIVNGSTAKKGYGYGYK